MKKKIHYLIAIALLLVCLAFVACAKIDGIYFEQEPRTLYVQGQELDFENTVLVALTGDKSEPLDIQSGEVVISGYDKDKLGEQVVTFTYQEKSTTIKVQVIPRIAVEGVSDKYFVDDLFDKSKGRIRVADDMGNITTVNLSSDLVTIVDFDSKTPATGRSVTVKYGEYTGTFPVDIYEVADVEMSAYPKTKAYDSHDTEFSVLGGYFTVTSQNGEYEKYVELKPEMVKGFAPSDATIENLNKPLKQTVKLEYLTFSFDFEVSITYSAVTMMNDRAEALKDVTDPFAATEAEGTAAWEAIVEYFKLAPADKKLISQEVKDHVVRIAAVYGFEQFKTASEDFKDTVDLVSRVGVIINEDEEEVEKTLGSFVFVAESYDGTLADLERLRDEDEPFVSYAEILRQVEDEFNDVEVVEGKDMDTYLDIVFSDDGLDLVIKVLDFLTELYEELEDVPTDWSVEDLPAFRSQFKRIVVTIRDSEFNPYNSPTYHIIYDLMSKWRENDDYFDIIFAYYLEYERDALVDELWGAVPCPGSMMQLYNALAYGLNATQNMRVGSDTTEFMYYYKKALEVADEIKAENDPLTMEIYELIDFDQLIDNYFFIGNSVEGRAYVYHVSSLFGNAQYGELMDIYLTMFEDRNTNGIDFEDADTQAKVRHMIEIYFSFSPAEQYAFLSALHCDYRYYMLNDYVLGYNVSEETGGMSAYSWFGYFVFNGYDKMLSEDGFDIFSRLMVASEIYALRFRSDDKLEEFTEQMAGIVADLDKLTDADKSIIGDILDSYILIYNTTIEPVNPDVSKYQDIFDSLLDAINRFYEMHVLMDDGNNDEAGSAGYFALYYTAYMRARTLLDELIATGDSDVLFVIENVYNIVISNGATGTQAAYSYDFILQEMANAYYSLLCKSIITGTDEDGETYTVSAFYLYYDSGLPAFLADAYTLLFKQYDNKGAELDPAYVLSVMEKYRNLSDDAYYVFVAMRGETLYREGVKACFEATLSDEANEVLDLLLSVEANYITYCFERTESYLANFKEAVDEMYDAYTDLADKSELDAFQDMYDYYINLYREMA